MSDLLGMPTLRRTARPENSSIPYLLINPPLTDPTCPYHSISYLVANCHEYGFTGDRCVDANVDALNFLSSPDQVAALLNQAQDVRSTLESKQTLTRAEELRYQAALAGVRVADDFVRRAIDVFRDPERFYHYPTYSEAVAACHRWLKLLSLRSLPGMYSGFALRTNGPANLLSRSDLTNHETIDAVTGAFLDYIQGPFRELLVEQGWRLVGFSVNFESQLPFALRMAQEVRNVCPEALIVFGGTEVCDDVKYARDPASLWDIFRDADLLVPGEGESPLVDILSTIRDGVPFDGLSGVLTPGSDTTRIRLNYENVGRLPTPRYDVWNWEAYWAPEPVVLYSPTRGCYWNKCTFCDYGLNTDRPTSPSRERPVDVAMTDLAEISRFARTLYFSVDAMSPRYLRTLAGAMAASELDLQWSAELRLERTFPKRGIAETLRQAGCVSIAFGYESASQRILDLIDKGVDVQSVPTILEHLAEAGIGAQLMGFTGFPTETPEEAVETFTFLARYRQLWTLAAVGQFGLTPGSIVAKQPERFGIEVLPLPGSNDIARGLAWRDVATGQVNWPGEDLDAVEPEHRARINTGIPGGRPFVGGIDSSHTLLYFGRNGRKLLPVGQRPTGSAGSANEQLVEVPFDDLDSFCSAADLEAAYHSTLKRHGSVHSQLMASWLDQVGSARPGRSVALVTPSGAVASLADTVEDIERLLRSLRILRDPAAAA